MKDIAVLITSCDKYEFCWDGFNKCFQKFWDFGLNWPIYFTTEEKSTDFKNIINIKTGKGAWSDNLICALDQTDSEYVFHIMEDFWIHRKIQRGIFASVFAAVKQYKFDTIRICEGKSVHHKVNELFELCGNPFYDIDLDKSHKYHVSYQAGIWRKKFLLRHLKLGENANQSEHGGTHRLMATRSKEPYRLGTYVYDWYLNAVVRKSLEIEEECKNLLNGLEE